METTKQEICNFCCKLFSIDQLKQLAFDPDVYICKACLVQLEEKYPHPTKDLDIQLPKAPLGRAQYNYSDGSILLSGKNNLTSYPEGEDHILLAIIHETIHYAIHKIEGIKECWQFDNLAHKAYNWNNNSRKTKYYIVAYGGME